MNRAEKTMTPNEIFDAPSINQEDWRETDADTILDVFGIGGFGYRFFDAGHPLDSARVVFSTKASHYNGDETTTKLVSVSFDGNPFALISVVRHDNEDRQVYITDERLFRQAREHIVTFLVDADHAHDVVDGSSFSIQGTRETVAVKVGNDIRLANPYHCRWSDGVLVFDEMALRDKFDVLVRPYFKELNENGLTGRDMRLRALEVLKAAVPPRFAVLDFDFVNGEGKWIACAFADGVHTHLISVDARDFKRGAGWLHGSTTRIGPPSMLHALECKAEGRMVTADSPAAREIESKFGLDAQAAAGVINDWLTNCSGDLCEAILVALDTEVPVDVQEGPLEGFRVVAYVADHPEAVVYCEDGYPSQKQARERMESLERMLARETAKVAAPSGPKIG